MCVCVYVCVCVCVCVRACVKERESETDRQTDRQTEIERSPLSDRQVAWCKREGKVELPAVVLG